MSIFSSIGHAISTGWDDIFGGGNNNSSAVTTTTTQAPFKQQNQPQQQPSAASLQKPANTPPAQPVVDASSLVKAKQFTDNQPQPSTPPPQPPQPKPSLLHQISTGLSQKLQPVEDVAKGVGSAAAGTALAATRIGEGLVQGAVNTPSMLLHGTNAVANKITGNTGVPSWVGKVDQATNTISKPVDWLAQKTDEAANAYGPEASAIYKPAQVIGNAALVVPAAAEGAASLLSKTGQGEGAAANLLSRVGAQGGRPTLNVKNALNTFRGGPADVTASEGATADELAEGVKSANPDQAGAPATTPIEAGPHPTQVTPSEPNGPSQNAPATQPPANTVTPPAETPPEVSNEPAFVRNQAKAAAAKGEAQEQVQDIANEPLGRPTFLHNQDIQDTINQGEQQLNDFIAKNPGATVADVQQAQATIKERVLGDIQRLQDARAGTTVNEASPAPTAPPVPTPPQAVAAEAVAEGRPIVQATDANGNPMQVSQKTAAQQAENANVNPNPAPIPPAVEQVAEAPPTSQAPIEAAGGVGVKSSRHIQAAIDNTQNPALKQAYEDSGLAKNNPGYGDLLDNAKQAVSGQSLPELIKNYGGDVPVSNAQQYYEKLQAMSELEKYPDVPEARQAAADALSSMTDFESNNGYNLGATRIAYDNMPTSMKVQYLNKLVQKAGGEFAPADLEKLYNEADVQGKLAQAAQEAENAVIEMSTKASQNTPDFNAQMKDLLVKEQAAKSALYAQNREVVDILERNLPKSDLGTRTAQQARTLMLSSVGGRAFALTGTGANLASYLSDNALSALYGKGINAVSRGNPVRASFARPGTLIKGAVEGVKGLAQEAFGKAPVKSVEGHLQSPYDSEYSHDTTRYGFVGRNITAPARKLVRFGVGSHLALTKGVEGAQLEQAARQAAQELAVPKDNMQGFVDFYKTHPPQAVAQEAKQAWLAVNNLHKNGVSDALGTVASGFEKLAGKTGGAPAQFIAKQIRTVMIPFSHYMGGFFNKAVTDRNMLYNAYRIVRARSPQELSDQLAHLTTNVGMAGGVGYTLARSGVITNKDQDGKNYDGLYFHLGNKYIPIAIAGQNALPIIMGAELYHSANDGSKGGSYPTSVVDDTLKATGIAGTFGDTTSTGALLAGDSGRGIPQIVGSAIRQHIPGVFGDVNSLLDQTSLNPTHEKALTKATDLNPTTGHQNTNNVQTEINKTAAVIPVLGQRLPRQVGEAAKTFADRALHAGEASSSQVATAKQSATDKLNDVPDPRGTYASGESFDKAVEARIENGQYDQAIAGLKQQLSIKQADKNLPKSESKSIQDHITTLQVTKDGGYDPAMIQLYKNTSAGEWRAMGDPTNENYDPATYQKLYNYDQALKAAGVSGSSLAGTKNKFTPAKGSGGGGSKAIKDNTVGNTPNLGMLSLGNLVPEKIGNAAIPTIQQMQAGQLIKPRAISVTKTR